MAQNRCHDCRVFVSADQERCGSCSERLEVTTVLRGLYPDTPRLADALRELIADRDAAIAYRNERHQRVLALVREKRAWQMERGDLLERIALLEAELAQRRPSAWERLKALVVGAG